MENFGAYLKAQREKKGIRLEEIASITKIHPHSLELIESNQWNELPPEPFIRGFILAYSKYVGLENADVLERYRLATGTSAAQSIEENMRDGQSGEPSREPTTRSAPVMATPNQLITRVRFPSGAKLITIASLIAVVGLATLLINVGKDAGDATLAVQSPAPTEIKDVAETTSESRTVASETKVLGDTAPPAAPVPTPAPAHEIVVEGKERTWMKVVIDDAPPQEVFLGEGKSASYKANEKIKVVLGNSTGSRVLYNGKEVDGTQFMGTIRTYKYPANARFPQDTPAKRATASDAPDNKPTE